jgi:hypothetical protein
MLTPNSVTLVNFTLTSYNSSPTSIEVVLMIDSPLSRLRRAKGHRRVQSVHAVAMTTGIKVKQSSTRRCKRLPWAERRVNSFALVRGRWWLGHAASATSQTSRAASMSTVKLPVTPVIGSD